MLYFIIGYYRVALHSTPLATTSETLAVQCCVPSGLNFEAAGYSIVYMLLFVLLFASRELSHCKWVSFRG